MKHFPSYKNNPSLTQYQQLYAFRRLNKTHKAICGKRVSVEDLAVEEIDCPGCIRTLQEEKKGLYELIENEGDSTRTDEINDRLLVIEGVLNSSEEGREVISDE